MVKKEKVQGDMQKKAERLEKKLVQTKAELKRQNLRVLTLSEVLTLYLIHNVICNLICLFLCFSFISNKEINEQKKTHADTNNIMEQRAVTAEEALAAWSGKLARVKASKTRSVEASQAIILQLQLGSEAAFLEHDEAEEARKHITSEARERIAIREPGSWGRRISDKFVRHARTLLSTGESARATLEQLHLNASFFLSAEDYEVFQVEVAYPGG